MFFFRRIACLVVSLLMLQTSVSEAGGLACASASAGMDDAGASMNHGSMAMPAAAKPGSESVAAVSPIVPADQSCPNTHAVSCITAGSCSTAGVLPSAPRLEQTLPAAAAVVRLSASMPLSPGTVPDVPPPKA